MAADSKDAVAHVQLIDGYRFTATFPDVIGAPPITLDQAPPLGTGTGPTPVGLLAAAVGGCLSASLTLCLNKAHLDPDAVNAHVTAHMGRNPAGRLRVEAIDVDLTPCFPGTDSSRFERCKITRCRLVPKVAEVRIQRVRREAPHGNARVRSQPRTDVG